MSVVLAVWLFLFGLWPVVDFGHDVDVNALASLDLLAHGIGLVLMVGEIGRRLR